jgi:hypothetical protein
VPQAVLLPDPICASGANCGFLPGLLRKGDSMLSVAPELRSRVTPAGAVILNISADEVITLNSTGGYIWALLQEGQSIDRIAASLATTTGHDPAIIAKDVREFMDQISMHGLITL